MSDLTFYTYLPSWCPAQLVDSGVFLLPWKPELIWRLCWGAGLEQGVLGTFTILHQYLISIPQLRPRFLFGYYHFCASCNSQYGILWGHFIGDKWPSSSLSEQCEAQWRRQEGQHSFQPRGIKVMRELASSAGLASSYVALCSTALGHSKISVLHICRRWGSVIEERWGRRETTPLRRTWSSLRTR